MVKRVGKYELGRTLGEGTFGKVKLAVNKDTRERVAIKVLDKEKILKEDMAEQIKKEISIMKMIKQKHVVNLLEVLVSKTKIYLVLELVTGGELFYKLANVGRFSDGVARRYFQQLIDGVAYCHSLGVVHRDLKPENLLLDDEGVLKISDFGLSSLYEQEGERRMLTTTCGTPNYVAPEVLGGRGYDGAAADLWSVGVILYVFLAGFLPFEESSNEKLFSKILRAEFEYPPWFSSDAKDLLNHLLVIDPKKRYSLPQIKKHRWFKVGYEEEQAEVPAHQVQADVEEAVAEDFTEAEERVEEKAKAKAGNGEEDAADEAGLSTMNAFDLIGMSGAFDLRRMLQRKSQAAGAGRDQPAEGIKRATQFTSEKSPMELIEKLAGLLKEMPVGFKIFEKSYKIKVTASSSKGLLTFVAQVYQMTAGLNMVEFRRGKGDIFGFHKLYREIYEKCADVMVKTEVPSSAVAGLPSAPSAPPPTSLLAQKQKDKVKGRGK